MKKQKNQEIESPFLTIGGLAEFLQVHKMTAYKLLQKNLIPGAFKVGSSWRIRKESLDQYFKEQAESLVKENSLTSGEV